MLQCIKAQNFYNEMWSNYKFRLVPTHRSACEDHT